MTIATIYPEEPKRILMLGLGGGSISTYLGRSMPDAAIDTVEIDRRVIEVAKQYFGLRETERVRYLDGDGRVFLNRNRGLYDLILLDAYRGGFVPFHLLTKEFYTLVKQRLTPGGAVASNVHDGTKLYHSTVKTLGEVFQAVDLYPSGLRRGDRARDGAAAAGQGGAGEPRRRAAGALQVPLSAAGGVQAPDGGPEVTGRARRAHHRRLRAGEPLRRDRPRAPEAEVGRHAHAP